MPVNQEQTRLSLAPSLQRRHALRPCWISNCGRELPVVSRCFKPSVMKLMRERLNFQSELPIVPYL